MRTLVPFFLLLLALPSTLLAAPTQDAELVEEVQFLFDQLGKGIAEDDSSLVESCLDADHLGDQMEVLGIDVPPGFVLGVRAGLTEAFLDGEYDDLPKSLELRSVEAEDDGYTRAITRTWDPEIEVWTTLRWWLVRGQDDHWRIYDWMDLDMGLRVSALMAGIVGDGTVVMGFITAMERFDNALFEDDYATCYQVIEDLADVDLPDSLAAVYFVQKGALELMVGEFQDALASFDRAESLSDETPVVHMLRCTVLSNLERYEEALASARLYQAVLGTDSESDSTVGYLLVELDRPDEALTVLLRAMDDNPACFEALEELMRLSGRGHDEELARRFAAFPEIQDWFDGLAGYLLEIEDLVAVRFACAQLDALAPEDTNAEYYLAEAKAAEGDYRDAAEILIAVIEDVPPGEFEYYMDSILSYGGLWADDVMWAYEQLPQHASYSFSYLAWNMDDTVDGDAAFERLATRHEKDHPGDYRPEFHRGRRAAEQGKHDVAEEHLARSMTLANSDADRSEVLEMRVHNLITDRDVQAAYVLEPAAEAWHWILDSCYWNEDAETLLAALALRRADQPEDPELAAWQGLAHFLRGEEEEAAEQLLAADLFDERLEEAGYTWLLQEAMVRAVIRTDRAKEARKFLIRQGVDPFHVLLLRAHLGNARRTASAVKDCLAGGWTPEELLQDEDLGPALADPDVMERLGWQ